MAESHQGPIALLLVDVVMPGLSGPEVATRLHAARPDTKVLFMSGFSTEVTVVHGVAAGDPLLVKPFSLETLGRKVKEIVEHRSPFSRPPQPPGRARSDRSRRPAASSHRAGSRWSLPPSCWHRAAGALGANRAELRR